MTSAAITTLVANRYACVGNYPNAQWNELHSNPYVLDYKMGPTSPTDPSDTTSHPTGTYAVAGSGGPQTTGTITYTYGSATYGYHVLANETGTNPWTATGNYSFCTTTGGQNLLVTISASHC